MTLTREQWLKESERSESEGSLLMGEAVLNMEIEDKDQLNMWKGDAESAKGRGVVGMARAALAHALKRYPDKKSLRGRVAELEKARAKHHSRLSSTGRCTTVRKPKSSGSCPQRISGSRGMSPLHAKCPSACRLLRTQGTHHCSRRLPPTSRLCRRKPISATARRPGRSAPDYTGIQCYLPGRHMRRITVYAIYLVPLADFFERVASKSAGAMS